MVKFTLDSNYNEKKYAENFLRYRWLFIKGGVVIDGENSL